MCDWPNKTVRFMLLNIRTIAVVKNYWERHTAVNLKRKWEICTLLDIFIANQKYILGQILLRISQHTYHYCKV